MIVHRGQIWQHTEYPADLGRLAQYYTPKNFTVFVCGVQNDEWVWYVHLLSEWDIDDERPVWRKAKMVEFEKKFTFINQVIAKRAYWKKQATGDLVQIIGVKDDGWKHIHVYYDLSKIDIHYFLKYFMPASREETLAAISRELNTPKNMRKMKRRLEMVKGDPNAPVTYE